MEINVSDGTTEGETDGGTQAELPPRGHNQQRSEHSHEAADAEESAGIEALRHCGRGRIMFGL